VGNEFGGTINPSFNVIETNANNNLFWGDMFERSDANDLTVSARINIGNTTSIASTNSKKIQFGQLTIGTGQTANIVLGTSSNAVITTFDSSRTPCVTMAYTMKGTGANAQRTGTLVVTSDSGSNAIAFTDDFTEVNRLQGILSRPFDEQPEFEQYALAPLPDEVVTDLSCSS
jgi:hypothetical protein